MESQPMPRRRLERRRVERQPSERREENRWMNGLDHWSTPVMANLLWAILSALLIPIPAALVGLLAVIYRWMDGQEPVAISVFFNTIRRVWIKAYLVAALDLLVGGLILVNLRIFEFMDGSVILSFVSRSVTISVAFVLILVNLYLWTLVAIWDAPLRRLIKLSVQLVAAQPLISVGMGVGVGIVAAITFFSLAVLFLVAAGSAGAYILTRGMRHVMTEYIPRDDFPLLDVH